MKVLCLNTCFSKTYLAIKKDDSVFLEQMDSSLKQSENVLGLINKGLNNLNCDLNNLDVISCVIGPGSFTGIRIGASLVKGICMALPNIKKIEINSLDLLAYSFAKKNDISEFWVVLNALSGYLYVCKYNGKGQQLIEPKLIYGEEINELNGVVVGFEEENLDICNKYVDFNCEDLLFFTEEDFKNNHFSNDFNPIYLRKSQAEMGNQ